MFPAQGREAIRQAGGLRELGAMLGRLTVLPVDGGGPARPGGSWHHFADGGPGDELAALGELLDGAAPAGRERAYRALRDEVAGMDAGEGLPRALAHPDFVLANAVAATDGRIVMIDWAGAGRKRLGESVDGVTRSRELAEAIADRARAAFNAR